MNWDQVLDVLAAADEDAWAWMSEPAHERFIYHLHPGNALHRVMGEVVEAQWRHRRRTAAPN